MAGTFIATVHTSLSFDPIIKTHATRREAESHMVEQLAKYGDWPMMAAITAARKGTPVLVRDNGDDETIEIRNV